MHVYNVIYVLVISTPLSLSQTLSYNTSPYKLFFLTHRVHIVHYVDGCGVIHWGMGKLPIANPHQRKVVPMETIN